MKLLSVITTMNPASGGPAQGIRNNIPFWKSYGIEVNVLSLDDPEQDYIKQENIIALGLTINIWGYSKSLFNWLIRNLQNYDVVLMHGLWLYHGFAVNKAVKLLRSKNINTPKVYIMPHGMLDPYFQKAPERWFKAIRNLAYWHLIEKHIVNNATGILYTCEEEMKLASTTFSCYLPKAEHNVGYGIVPPPAFSEGHLAAFYGKCSAVSNKPYFLFLSRIHQKKGVDILLKSYAILFDYCNDNRIVLPDLVIAGPGMDTDYGKYLMDLLETFPIIKLKVHFPGMLQGASKWGALYGADLFVLPSHQENFGIAIVEAMACKTAVLVTNKVNIWREIVQEGGGIMTNDNVESVLSALKIWINLTVEEKLKMGEKAYATYDLYFTAESTSKKFISVIKR